MTPNEVPFELIVDYVDGRLSEIARGEVEAAVESDEQIANTVRHVQELRRSLGNAEAVSPSTSSVARTIELYADRHRAASAASWIELARRTIAELVFDSRKAPALAGYRGRSTDIQLAFEHERGRLDLRVTSPDEPAHDRWQIRGQIRWRQPAGLSEVCLVHSGTAEVLASTFTDKFGGFQMESAAGAFDCLVEVDAGAEAMIAPGLIIPSET